MKKLLIATKNKGKLIEITEMLSGIDVDIISLNNINVKINDVVEDGETFRENAIKKAMELSSRTGIMALADDSGLVVDILNGAPGIFSARYAGEEKDDQANRRKLLDELKHFDGIDRTARFVCVIAIAEGNNIVTCVEGVVEGRIAYEEKGYNGFGYDSIFYYPPFEKTFAEIDAVMKNSISHRYKALLTLKDYLSKYTL